MFMTGMVRIGNEPVVRYTANNDPVLELSLAYYYGKRDENGKQQTQWIKATLWGKRAQTAAQYMLKGNQLFVVLNDIHNETYEKKDGTSGITLRAKIAEFQFVDKAKILETREEHQAIEERKTGKKPSFDDLDDDIPF